MRRQAEDLSARLQVRTKELQNQRHLGSNPPLARGAALIVPQALIEQARPPGEA